jgi:hypothetical protein
MRKKGTGMQPDDDDYDDASCGRGQRREKAEEAERRGS